MELTRSRPPLPKLAWVAAVVAFLDTAYLVFDALAQQTIVVLPFALIPLLAGVGILRRNIWSARGFALLQISQIAALLLINRSTSPDADGRMTLIASAILSAASASLFLLASRSLARAQGNRGRPQAWIAISILSVCPWLFIQAFSIPTGAMEETLLVGDSVLAQRWPKPAIARGDVVIFPYPVDPRQKFVKRVVGVPGDHLRIASKILHRNGAQAGEPYAVHKTDYVEDYRDNFPGRPDTTVDPPALEMLTSHVVNGELVVPAGKYFVLGDNRDSSFDSRYFGFIDAASVLGKPLLIYNSVDRPVAGAGEPHGRGRVRWNRLFQIVR